MTRTTGSSVDTYSYLGTSDTVVRIANTGGTGAVTDSISDPAGDRLGTKTGSTVAWLTPDLHGSIAAGLAQTPSAVTDAIRTDGYGQTVAVWPSGGSPVTTSWKYQGRLDLSPSSIPLYAARVHSSDPAESARAQGQVAGMVLALLLPLKGLRGAKVAAADPLIDLANASRRTGVRFASEYTSPSGSTYYDVNQARALPQDHPLVATGHHGGCAEFGCLLQAYEAEGLPGINGGSMRTVFVRSPKSNVPDGPSTGHGAPATPCVGFCQPLLDLLGVRW